MTDSRLKDFVRSRTTDRGDTEHVQIAIRLIVVSVAVLYFFSGYFEQSAPNAEYVSYVRWLVSIVFAVNVSLLVALLIRPGVSVVRRSIAPAHDIAAISAGLYLGEGAAAALAAVYFWVTLGNGFRFGIKYLYGCAILSFIGFGTVYLVSDYWQTETTLSVVILILLGVIPPYVGGLLNSLHATKAKLKQQASFDGLTGLMNRAEAAQSIKMVLDEQHEGHFLLYCDLDHFKTVNDVAGHAAGDKLLTDVGKIIKDCVRGDDLTARLGGDEFCVFLKRCPLERAREIAEKIRNAVSGYRLAWGREYYKVGISIGAAPSAAVKDMDSLFRLADAACYAAKNAGRNQVHVVDPRSGIVDTACVRRLFKDRDDGATNISETAAEAK